MKFAIYLIINAGSSSVKFQLFRSTADQNEIICSGLADRIGIDGKLKINYGTETKKWNCDFSNHNLAINQILKKIKELNLIKDFSKIDGVGHRIVHGGKYFIEPIIANPEVIAKIQETIPLAPLHNPANLAGIAAVKKIIKAPNVLVFDTTFHRTIPELQRLYPLPQSWNKENNVEKYGFHGISYQYIVGELEKINNNQPVDAIICHLGNGSSVAAIKNSKSIDTSMGLTPLAGLMMGTRSGDIDPGIIQYIGTQRHLSLAEISTELNKKSGLLAVSGVGSDMREILTAAGEGNKNAQLALDMYAQRVADVIVKYANLIGTKIKFLVFTAGIGENDQYTVNNILQRLPLLALNLKKNLFVPGLKMKSIYYLSAETNSNITVMIVKTNEELMICKITKTLIGTFSKKQ